MNKIENYNCDGLCQVINCSKKYTHFTNIILNGMHVLVGFCEKHAQIHDDNYKKEEDGDEHSV